mgnify:FL=1
MAWLSDLRNTLLTRPGFRARVQKLPFFQGVARRQSEELFRLCSGFIHSQVLLACVRTGLLEQLADGPLAVARIAERTGLTTRGAEHLLAAATGLGLTERRRGERFGLGMLGAAMVDNSSVRAMLEHHALLYHDLTDPVPLFSESRPASALAGLWPYAGADRPRGLEKEDVEAYSSLMAESQAMVAEQVLDACSLGGVRTLLDIGGGSGAFAMAAAARWPALQVTVADLPAVASLARERIAAAGLSGRIGVVAADAAKDPLPGGFDAVSMIRIVHDHDDGRVVELLSSARRALDSGGMLLVAEPMSDAPGAGALIETYFSVYLLAMGTGKPRTSAQIEQLLREAGFGKIRRRPTDLPLVTSVITAQVREHV